MPTNLPGYGRNYWLRKRQAAFARLGDVCGEYGFSDVRALQIDHVKHQAGGRESGYTTIRRVLADEPGYQLLCANCNWIKRVDMQEDGNRERRISHLQD